MRRSHALSGCTRRESSGRRTFLPRSTAPSPTARRCSTCWSPPTPSPRMGSRGWPGYRICSRSPAGTRPSGSGAGAERYDALLEPVMSVRLVVEGVDFDIAGGAIHRDGLGERAVGLQPQNAAPVARGAGLELGEEAAPDAEPARRRGDPP